MKAQKPDSEIKRFLVLFRFYTRRKRPPLFFRQALSSGSRKMMPTYAVLTADQDMLRENVRIAPPEWGLDLAEDE